MEYYLDALEKIRDLLFMAMLGLGPTVALCCVLPELNGSRKWARQANLEIERLRKELSDSQRKLAELEKISDTLVSRIGWSELHQILPIDSKLPMYSDFTNRTSCPPLKLMKFHQGEESAVNHSAD